MALSLFTILINYLTKLPPEINIKWLILFVLSSLLLLLNRRFPSNRYIPFIALLITILLYMPYAFINSGGGKGDFIAFAFFALIIISYIMDGIYQKILFAALIVVFIVLHILDYVYPELIPVYDPVSRFYDRLIQVPVLIFTSYMIIRTFTDAYNETNNRLYYYASYDMLTGLLNRWGFSELLSKGLKSSYRDGYLLLIDIDNFKLINDRRGHKTGDEVLRRFGEILNGYFNDNKNLVCRWGGDEFVVLFFDGEERLDNLIGRVTGDFLDYINKIEPLVDISIGSAFLKDCLTVEDVLVMADQFMYKQKNAKRH
jgi:diguanylate cyclase (GGDEF)-like protein